MPIVLFFFNENVAFADLIFSVPSCFHVVSQTCIDDWWKLSSTDCSSVSRSWYQTRVWYLFRGKYCLLRDSHLCYPLSFFTWNLLFICCFSDLFSCLLNLLKQYLINGFWHRNAVCSSASHFWSQLAIWVLFRPNCCVLGWASLLLTLQNFLHMMFHRPVSRTDGITPTLTDLIFFAIATK